MGISHVGQHVATSHRLQHFPAFPHLNHNHIDAIRYVCAEQYEHRIEPVANVETSAIVVAYAENRYDGDINASADDAHLSAVGMGRLNVVYAHGDSGEAWGIDKDIEDGSQVIAFRTKAQEHLQEILYGKSHHACKYHPA